MDALALPNVPDDDVGTVSDSSEKPAVVTEGN
jgi:hypothetical protein